jgi:uncharacterized protein (DUF1330 family)
MKGYWIARVNIKNQNAYKSYAQLAKPAIEKHNGRYLARGGKQKILEGLELERAVIVEFPSMAKALECYNSKEYAEAKSHREGAAEFHGVIVEGI